MTNTATTVDEMGGIPPPPHLAGALSIKVGLPLHGNSKYLQGDF